MLYIELWILGKRQEEKWGKQNKVWETSHLFWTTQVVTTWFMVLCKGQLSLILRHTFWILVLLMISHTTSANDSAGSRQRELLPPRVCLLQSSAFEIKSPGICLRMPGAERRGPGMLDPLLGQLLGHRYAEVVRCSPSPLIMLLLWSACDYQFPVCLLSINQARLWRGNFICSLKKKFFFLIFMGDLY